MTAAHQHEELFSEERSAEVVAASLRNIQDSRLREVLMSLVHHLHTFVKTVDLTEDEWSSGIAFLTETGKMCSDVRQEFILLSDVLGVSMLVATINHRSGGTSTESTVLGPFHMVESPPRELGDDINWMGGGTPCLVSGRVTDEGGVPLRGASIDIWQTNGEGFYDVQQPDVQPPGNLRGAFVTNAEGRFWFRSVIPSDYPIPTDGPVGQLLSASNRHPNRPAHVHVIAQAPGYRSITTHIFLASSVYLSSDPVFGVKGSLVRDVETVDDPARAVEVGLPNPFCSLTFDLAMHPQEKQTS